MKRTKRAFLNKRKILFAVIFSIVIIIFATGIDFLFHQLSEEYSVPSRYFPNKIIYGAVIIFLCLFVFRKISSSDKAIVVSLITGSLLQVKYFFEGYPSEFVFVFLSIHFFALLIPSWIILNKFDKYIF